MSSLDNSVIIENLTQLLTNSVNMAAVFYDIFLNPEPMDVELQQYSYKGSFASAHKVLGDLTQAIAFTSQLKFSGSTPISTGTVVEVRGTNTIDGNYTVSSCSVLSNVVTVEVSPAIQYDFNDTGATVGTRLGTITKVDENTSTITIAGSVTPSEGDTIYLEGLNNFNNYEVNSVAVENELILVTVTDGSTLNDFINVDNIDRVIIPNRAKDRRISLVGDGSPEGVITANVGTCYVDELNDAVYFKATGTGNTGWVSASDETSVQQYVRTYLANNKFVNEQSLNVYLTTNKYTTEQKVGELISNYKPTILMTNLVAVSGTRALADNTGYSITLSGNVTFNLPTVTDLTYLHKIFVQLYMPSIYSVNLGTSNYFDKLQPIFDSAGMYNIMYEYDNARGVWVVGAMSKGAA